MAVYYKPLIIVSKHFRYCGPLPIYETIFSRLDKFMIYFNSVKLSSFASIKKVNSQFNVSSIQLS